MRALAYVGALIASVLRSMHDDDRAAKRSETAKKLTDALRVATFHKRGRGNGGRFTRKLRKKFAANALARHGYDETVDKTTRVHFRSPEMRRVMRNARKLERQQATR